MSGSLQAELAASFATSLGRLLPPDLPPRLALAVSGGADSTALALLARDYCQSRGGRVLALIVDHGLRPDSALEASLTSLRLQKLGLSCRVLTLSLAPGPAMQERARLARYQALAMAALSAGFVYLALGHHQADQYETVAMRRQRGTGGGEGMSAWSAREHIVLLRPLLTVRPEPLRWFLREQGVTWVEDPSNQRRCFERVRIRQDQAGQPPSEAEGRVAREQAVAVFLARHVTFYPEGYAVLAAESAPESALAALIRTVGGRLYAPRQEAVRRLATCLGPATLGGVRLTKAGRLGQGWLLAREPAACAPPVRAVEGTSWDGRFTLLNAGPEGAHLGALGAEAHLFKGYQQLPSLVLRGMPALRGAGGDLIFPAPVRFIPPLPMASRPFHR